LTTQAAFVSFVANLPPARQLDVVLSPEGKPAVIDQPWVILFYTTSALVAGVVVSLFTPRVPAERLKRFYDLTRTPVTESEVVEQPCTLPKGVEPPIRRMLLTSFGLEVPMPSATSIVGFLIGCAAAVLLVVAYLWLIVW
jgi:hypothetical protein